MSNASGYKGPFEGAGIQERSRNVILAGVPRCGTTLLASVLNAQPACGFVTDYIDSVHWAASTLRVQYGEQLSQEQKRIALAIVRDELIRIGHLSVFGLSDFGTLNDLTRCVLADLLEKKSGILGHKSRALSSSGVASILCTDSISVLVILRDPRDAALSYWHRNGFGVEEYCERWNDFSRLCEQFSDHPNLFWLKYEDFTRQNKDLLRRLENWLGMSITMSKPRRFSQGTMRAETPWTSNSAFGDIGQALSTAPIGRWERHKESQVVAYSNWACRDQLIKKNYQVWENPLPIGISRRFHMRRRLSMMKSSVDRNVRKAYELIDKACAPIKHISY
jgi:hypothetical protein